MPPHSSAFAKSITPTMWHAACGSSSSSSHARTHLSYSQLARSSIASAQKTPHTTLQPSPSSPPPAAANAPQSPKDSTDGSPASVGSPTLSSRFSVPLIWERQNGTISRTDCAEIVNENVPVLDFEHSPGVSRWESAVRCRWVSRR
jgi:hypothetical protein